MAEHTRLPLRKADGGCSPHREAAAGGARGPGGSSLERAPMEGGRTPFLCRWLSDTTREAHRTSRGGSSPNNQPPAPPPGPCRPSPCLHICTCLSPPGTRQ